MTVHLLKLCVGIDEVPQLEAVQARRLAEMGKLRHVTRFTPRRAAEVLDGGSLYWVVRRFIRVRQPILGFEEVEDGKCGILLAPKLVLTRPLPFRAFQGWRYLRPEDAPPDAPELGQVDSDMPAHMVDELRELGLL
ncbi:MAG: DUF1489 domain-containing protein [Hyphomicrobiales bacterium]|nr:DUF1489 domain-containing protein [Hyphomicrobiales bacterium]MCP5373897.1 DUF1489 domain-containing protein [Hyphomicrobiales bacterium]